MIDIKLIRSMTYEAIEDSGILKPIVMAILEQAAKGERYVKVTAENGGLSTPDLEKIRWYFERAGFTSRSHYNDSTNGKLYIEW